MWLILGLEDGRWDANLYREADEPEPDEHKLGEHIQFGIEWLRARKEDGFGDGELLMPLPTTLHA